MQIVYRLSTTNRHGQTELIEQSYGLSLVIGRGGRSDIILQGREVSLEHARIYIQNENLYIEDLNSISGVQHNGILVNNKKLLAGDRVKIGLSIFEVLQEGDTWCVLEKRDSNKKENESSLIEKLRIENNLPKYRYLILIGSLTILAWYFLLPLAKENQVSWTSGKISNSHKMLETDCVACHTESFAKVEDNTCLSCHELTEHSEEEPSCITCHTEHKDSVTVSASKLCVDCHIDAEKTKLKKVDSFKEHPEFQLPKKDQATIKLNHKLHIIDEGMQCADCHQINPKSGRMQKISFKRDCQSCHFLTFDDRLPELEVPHGEPDNVFNFMYAEYAKLFLDDQPKIQITTRKRPGENKTNKEANEFTRKAILEEARSAEEELFTRTACHLCHEISKTEKTEGKSYYKVSEPRIPEVWLSKSIFDHRAHENLSCESCHAGVKKSELTSDVLLPELKDCQACHAGSKKNNKVTSDCIMCHSYHDSLDLPVHKKQDVFEIIKGLK